MQHMPDKTIFQKIIDREEPASIHYEDDVCIVIDAKFQAEGTTHHMLVIPKKLIPTIMEATSEDAEIIGKLHIVAAHVAKEKGIANYKLVFNAGKYLHVQHLHLHLICGDKLHD